MKRAGFAPKFPPRPETTQCTYTPRPRAAAVAIHNGKARMVISLPKANPVRDEAYRRRVAALSCAHCGRPGPSQCAHADLSKGMGIKSSDADTFPACADAPGRRGCHSLIGASGMFTQEQRRTLETKYVAQTRELLERMACQP